jgi:hypothetical protein
VFLIAVLNEIPGLKITVHIDGQAVAENVDPHASEANSDENSGFPVISKYIKVIDDTAFEIKLTVNNDEYAWDDPDHVRLCRWEKDRALCNQ